MLKSLPPSTKKGISPGQITKVQEMFGHALRKSIVLKNFPTSEIDSFIKENDLYYAIVNFMYDQHKLYVGYRFLTVDYNLPGAIAKAIKKVGFDLKKLSISPENIPLVGTGKVQYDVRKVHFSKTMYTRDLLNALNKRGKELGFPNGLKFADPLTALCYASTLSGTENKYPIAILFSDAKGQLWYLLFEKGDKHRGDFFKRSLYIHRVTPDRGWNKDIRWLAVEL